MLSSKQFMLRYIYESQKNQSEEQEGIYRVASMVETLANIR